MVIIKTCGGLGNQLFQYAAAFEIAKKCDDIVVFDLELQKKDKRRFELKNLGIKGKLLPVIQKERLIYRLQNFLLKFYIRSIAYSSLDNKMVRYLFGMAGVFFCNYNNPDMPICLFKCNTILVAGSFFNEKYFASIINGLRVEINDYSARYPLNKNVNMVCVHIRRGDYVGNTTYEVCTDNYYYRAMDEMERRIGKCNFMIFSDDIEYVKKRMKFTHSYTICEEKNVCKTLYYMVQCDHYIISNSTFSWWAQELNNNKKKIVIAPKRWFNTDGIFELYDESWIKMA